MPRRHAFLCQIILLTLAATLSACASAPQPNEHADINVVNDPLESWNRRVFDNNTFFDRLLVEPLAGLYRVTIPPGIRDRIADILSNMKEPVILANDLMQGDFSKAGVTVERFGINTTLGVGGMWDVADAWDLHQQTGDFGQTLASWGVGEGPYLMLPIFGPSNFRDAFGRGVDIALSPWQYFAYIGGTTDLIHFEAAYFGTDILVRREKNIERINALRSGSLDFYATARSAYRQYRNRQLGNLPEKVFPESENDR